MGLNIDLYGASSQYTPNVLCSRVILLTRIILLDRLIEFFFLSLPGVFNLVNKDFH